MGTLENGVIDEINKYVYDKILSRPPFHNFRARDNGINKKIGTRYVVDLPLKGISDIMFDGIVSYKCPKQSQTFDRIPLATYTKKDMQLSFFFKKSPLVRAIMFVDPICNCSSWRDIRYDNIEAVEYRFVLLDFFKRFLDYKRFDAQSLVKMCNYMRETKKALKTQINGLEFEMANVDGLGYIFLKVDKRLLNSLSIEYGVANAFEKS